MTSVYIWTEKVSTPEGDIGQRYLEPFVAVLFAIILVRGSWHASGSGVCNKTSPFPCPTPDFSKRVDGPRSPHFARHTRRCATRLFAEALKSGGELRKNKLFRPAGEIIHCTPSFVANVFLQLIYIIHVFDKSRIQISGNPCFLSETK